MQETVITMLIVSTAQIILSSQTFPVSFQDPTTRAMTEKKIIAAAKVISKFIYFYLLVIQYKYYITALAACLVISVFSLRVRCFILLAEWPSPLRCLRQRATQLESVV